MSGYLKVDELKALAPVESVSELRRGSRYVVQLHERVSDATRENIVRSLLPFFDGDPVILVDRDITIYEIKEPLAALRERIYDRIFTYYNTGGFELHAAKENATALTNLIMAEQ